MSRETLEINGLQLHLVVTEECPPDRIYLLAPRETYDSEEEWLQACAVAKIQEGAS